MSGTRWGAGKLASQYQVDVNTIKATYQPRIDFDESKFHFKKDELRDIHTISYPGKEDVTSVFKVNLSPILPGNCVYIPFIEQKLPQYIYGAEVIEDLLDFYSNTLVRNAENDNFTFTYNGNGAASSVNHLHFQCFDNHASKALVENKEPLYLEWMISNLGNTDRFQCFSVQTRRGLTVKHFKPVVNQDGSYADGVLFKCFIV